MFPDCCFHQRIYESQDHVNGEPNETGTDLYKCIPVSLGALFIWPCDTYVLRRMQQTRNIHICKNEINNS